MPHCENDSPKTITIGGINYKFLPSESNTHYIGIASQQIIKIENRRHENKLRTLDQEAEVVRYLNNQGCISCPRLFEHGKLDDGRPYFIEERILPQGKAVLGDILLALFEQKQLGVYQGDLHPGNIIFNGETTYLIDYDQAIMSEELINMGEIEFLNWVSHQKIPAYVLEREKIDSGYADLMRLLSRLPRHL
jgi:predicted Ser/Thr protein kinase